MPKTVLMVIAQETFRDEEYAQPKLVLESFGATVVTASVEAGPCVGKLGLRVDAEIALRDADPADYDAVAFVGGAGASVFFDDPVAHALVRSMYGAGKVIAAICIAPSILARAGLLKNRTVTSFPSQAEDLKDHGAFYTGRDVEFDGRIVTANGPEAAYAFGETIGDSLGL